MKRSDDTEGEIVDRIKSQDDRIEGYLQRNGIKAMRLRSER